MTVAFIGLGANLCEPRAQVSAAVEALALLHGSRLLASSSLYRGAPQGFAAQPDFVNAVAKIETTLAPRALLEALMAIEHAFGRKRTFADAPRTLDLDLLLYGDQAIEEPGLRVPHPRMHQRAFVLAPLAEIAPEARIPGHGPIAPLLALCASQRLEKLE
jgi:2-amino-4-hydroxy-6-hydroxymethyldihydropteridine diphosphokinase